MAADVSTRVVIDDKAIKDIETDPGTVALLLEAGERIATIGAGFAARRTGAGARSFHAEWESAPVGEVHVSWDDVHFYMYFHEFGATNTPRQPALSVAVDIVAI